MGDSWVTINSHKTNGIKSKPKNQVKFIFGDDDSDSSRSYQNSPQTKKSSSKPLSKSPSVSNKFLSETNGLDILNNIKTKPKPSSPSIRISSEKAVGSAILPNLVKPEVESSNTKLPITSQFLMNNKLTATQIQATLRSSKSKSNELTQEHQHQQPLTSSQNPIGRSNAGSTISRTQAKLMLQRQHSYNEDESSLNHPQNQIKLSKELDKINREFLWLRKYHNPVQDSLTRVMERKRMQLANSK
ncbi:hypothetical protein K502DRAFT_364877 [Neoconidiobolus thromboides FSU 785]|nr:hypothetical protein K502DRAFT_364877 [Neoconidiobolus thromboides FSU 785]